MAHSTRRAAAVALFGLALAAPARPALDAMSEAQATIEPWPVDAKDLAGAMLGEYGPPDEAAPDHLAWSKAAPWERIVVFRDPKAPDQPDRLLQSVAYRVPLKRWRALTSFHRGVSFDPARDELVARTGREDTNFLALNLADEVIRGRRTGAEADAFFDKTSALAFSGKSSSYMRKLLFTPRRPR